ncbi:MAG: hypothetical protein AAB354_10790 [candidate division KSB1 bacterium]
MPIKNTLDHWEQVPFFGDRIKIRAFESYIAGWKRGWLEGRDEATAEVLQENIINALDVRFGISNRATARIVKAIDEPWRLESILRTVISADSVSTVKSLLALEKSIRMKKRRLNVKRRTKASHSRKS